MTVHRKTKQYVEPARKKTTSSHVKIGVELGTRLPSDRKSHHRCRLRHNVIHGDGNKRVTDVQHRAAVWPTMSTHIHEKTFAGTNKHTHTHFRSAPLPAQRCHAGRHPRHAVPADRRSPLTAPTYLRTPALALYAKTKQKSRNAWVCDVGCAALLLPRRRQSLIAPTRSPPGEGNPVFRGWA